MGAFSILTEVLAERAGTWSLAALFVLAGSGTLVTNYRMRRMRALSFRVRFNSPLVFGSNLAHAVASVAYKTDVPDAGATTKEPASNGGSARSFSWNWGRSARNQDTAVAEERNPGRGEVVIKEPALVVARLKNVGMTGITDKDPTLSDEDFLELDLGGRTVIDARYSEMKPPSLETTLARYPLETGGKTLTLPFWHLNRGEEYKVVVLLSNDGVASPRVQAKGRIQGGVVLTDTDTLRTRRVTYLGAALSALLAGALIASLVFIKPATSAPAVAGAPVCAQGQLTVEGSTAFAGLAAQLAQQYMATCPKAHITVRATGSIEGLNWLNDSTQLDEQRNRLAMAEGRFPGFDKLQPSTTVAVVPFSVVVNPGVKLKGISAAGLRRIFLGQVTNWKDVDPEAGDKPIRVVGRDDHSGSRRTLEKFVLDGKRQTGATSDNCDVLRESQAGPTPIVCEQTSTSDVLAKVRTRDGAIGYVSTPEAVPDTSVNQLTIDDRSAGLAGIRSGYAFWAVEYLYSYGPLIKTDKLTQAFAAYLTGAQANAVIAAQHYSPCVRDGNPEDLCVKQR
ncbi:phosphate ABC transporter substrate-binding protein [Actinoplanes cyaneus]|uniref:Phosphate ABC transporter substrate-binding protein n=1 Tax=Actinoplanes cyaneus TaxID=52696 RepID=A0A919IIC2_9ACTN|nr:substrate-binding domain-containing protein [Actinoplanes cyaneus]MCW2136190.1 phosphate ABC transporter substrate-binding protein, PhoT family [Actinoplanes cyaneus]GID62440.1 phosphate ABC transporter substrate-binding protein [Actinoplanes cyaneus]